MKWAAECGPARPLFDTNPHSLRPVIPTRQDDSRRELSWRWRACPERLTRGKESNGNLLPPWMKKPHLSPRAREWGTLNFGDGRGGSPAESLFDLVSFK